MDPASRHQPLLCNCGENELTPVHVGRRMSIHSVDSYFFLVARPEGADEESPTNVA
jgi:hypothetical protein